MPQDQYLVYARNDGTMFYYKNKKLHRDAGPAIVIAKDIQNYSNLGDEDLYKKSISPVIDHSEDNGIMKYINDIEDNFGSSWGKPSYKSKGLIHLIDNKNSFWESDTPKLEQYELAWNNSAFFLNGKELTEANFKKQKAKQLNKELGNELPKSNVEKTPKLKL